MGKDHLFSRAAQLQLVRILSASSKYDDARRVLADSIDYWIKLDHKSAPNSIESKVILSYVYYQLYQNDIRAGNEIAAHKSLENASRLIHEAVDTLHAAVSEFTLELKRLIDLEEK